jgi:predicted peptidase
MFTRRLAMGCAAGLALLVGCAQSGTQPQVVTRMDGPSQKEVKGVAAAPAAPVEAGQHAYQFQKVVTREVACPYLLYLPKDYGKDDRRWPLMLFLHGAGERGEDLKAVKVHGPPKLIDQGKEFPFIVLSPQCPADSWWDSDVLHALLTDIIAKYRVDEHRVYCTGLSMGGYGTWDLAIKYPKLFAAIAPICGGAGSGPAVCKIKDVPVWTFHGDKDTTVPMAETEYLVKRLKECGGNVKFTVYPGVGHDSWVKAYNDQALYEWFLSQRRP